MKRNRQLFLVFLIAASFISCEENSLIIDPADNLYGVWIYESSDSNFVIMKKAQNFDESKPGFSINKEGKFIERKNSGWCGTPPISYSNYEGEWNKKSDELFEVSVGYWGGIEQYQIKIISLTEIELRYSRLQISN